MSDNTFQPNESFKASDKQTADLALTSQALQVGANEMKAISGGNKNAAEAIGLPAADDLLAGFSESNTKQAADYQTKQAADYQTKPADSQAKPATIAELELGLAASKAQDNSPEQVAKLTQDKNLGLHSAEDVKNFVEKRTFGQAEFIQSLDQGQLKLIGELASAIKNGDDAKMEEALKSVKPGETDLVAFCVQYELKAQGVDNIHVKSVHLGGEYRMAVINSETDTAKNYDEKSGKFLGSRHVAHATSFAASERAGLL